MGVRAKYMKFIGNSLTDSLGYCLLPLTLQNPTTSATHLGGVGRYTWN